MAEWWVKHSATGSVTAKSWDGAARDLYTVRNAAAAGDTVYVHYTHVDASSGTPSFANGIPGNPLRIISVNDDLVPTPGATAKTNILTAGSAYIYGLTLPNGTHANTEGAATTLDNCVLEGTVRLGPASLTYSSVTLKNVVWRPTAASSHLWVTGCEFSWEGGGIDTSVAAPTKIFQVGGSSSSAVFPAEFAVSGVDLSHVSTSTTLFSSITNLTNSPVFRAGLSRCALPVNWTGVVFAGATGTKADIVMAACDSSAWGSRLLISGTLGRVVSETARVRDGGAVVDGTPFAWGCQGYGGGGGPNLLQPMVSPEIFRAWPGTDAEVAAWTPGQSVTATVEVLMATYDIIPPLTNEDCWLEVTYFGSATSPLGSIASGARADIFAAPTAHDLSDATWYTEGMTGPIRQKLSVTFTPEMPGYFTAVVKLGKPGASTIFVCPKIEVSAVEA